jgi:ATP-dependent Clp protease, protease subunit
MSSQPTTPARKEVYAVFCDLINQDSIKRIFQSCAFATQNGIAHMHLMFQSTGGMVADGVCLYNFFKTFPIDLTLYNCGSVQSIAAVAYLGAKKRKTSARATFMIHRTTATPQSATAGRLHSIAESILTDDKRTESILREHITLSPEEWSDLNNENLFFSGEEGVKVGFADEIGEFAPVLGGQVYSI